MTGTPWETDIIARYLTPAGATVDLRVDGDATVADCTACPAEHRTPWSHADPEAWLDDGELAEHGARRWAQTHAETCRAMRRPDDTGVTR